MIYAICRQILIMKEVYGAITPRVKWKPSIIYKHSATIMINIEKFLSRAMRADHNVYKNVIHT